MHFEKEDYSLLFPQQKHLRNINRAHLIELAYPFDVASLLDSI